MTLLSKGINLSEKVFRLSVLMLFFGNFFESCGREAAPLNPLFNANITKRKTEEKKCLLGGPITKPMDLAITLCPFLLISILPAH